MRKRTQVRIRKLRRRGKRKGIRIRIRIRRKIKRGKRKGMGLKKKRMRIGTKKNKV